MLEAERLFNVESLAVASSSVEGMKNGVKASLSVSGRFMGQHREWSGSFTFPPDLHTIMEDVLDVVKGEMEGDRFKIDAPTSLP